MAENGNFSKTISGNIPYRISITSIRWFRSQCYVIDSQIDYMASTEGVVL
jgi:hypothetical protein